MITDEDELHRLEDKVPSNMLAKLGTFAPPHLRIAESQVIKVEKDLPLKAVALVSCGVATRLRFGRPVPGKVSG